MDEKGLIEITQDHIFEFSKWREKENGLRQAPASTQQKGLQCKPEFTEVDLKFIFTKLDGILHKSVIEADFVAAFQAGTLTKKIHWTGSNPELATLVNQLTGSRPIPSIVNPIFKTKLKYDNNSSSRTDNKVIIQIITGAKK
jgi:hypothetical protein